VNPSRYEAMVEALEDYALFFEAEKRLAAANNEYIKSEALLSELGVSDADLNEVVVDIG
jgi:hypothetical protein